MASAMKIAAPRISRRRFLGGVSVLAAGTFGYAHFIEAEWLQVTRLTVPMRAQQRRPIKLLHLSDLHASHVVSMSYISRSIDRALEFRPDLICVTGDFVTATYNKADDYSRVLGRLSSAAPTFAVLGNHDGGKWAIDYGGYPNVEWITKVLRDSKITLLENRFGQFKTEDRTLNIVGVGDAWSGLFDPNTAFTGVNPEQPTVVLSHNSDTKEHLFPQPWDLMLSGHTHGGQLRIPLIGAPFAPVSDRRFLSGLHRWNDRWLHVTRGVGNIYGMRINCPPEVSFLTLT
jgi:uncharacterized protein